MNDIHSPRHYFLQALLRAYEELGKTLLDGVLGNRRDLIAAGRAAEACLHLADHVAADPNFNQTIPGAPRSKEYVKHLTAQSRDFAIVRDVANSFKHRKISLKQRNFDGIEAIVERWALVRFTDDNGHYWATQKVVIVRLKSGIEIFVEDVIERCIGLWIQELLRLGAIASAPHFERTPKRYMLRSDVPVKPQIELRAVEGEYYESQPVILVYDKDDDRLHPMRDKIGRVDVDVKMVVDASPFATDADKMLNGSDLRTKDECSE